MPATQTVAEIAASFTTRPNLWLGFDMGGTADKPAARLTVVDGVVHVYTFDGWIVDTEATFSSNTPPAAIVAYLKAMAA